MPFFTTLNQIREHGPCGIEANSNTGLRHLLNGLGKNTTDDEPLNILTILDQSGIDDAIWCLRALPPEADEAVRYFARMCAVSVIEYYPNGTDDAVFDWLMTGDARSAAYDAAFAASRSASRSAACASANSAVCAASRFASYAAAFASANAAANAAACAAAYAAQTNIFREVFE